MAGFWYLLGQLKSDVGLSRIGGMRSAFAPVLIAAASPLAAADMTPDQRAFFEAKIRPALIQHCYECHSQSADKIGGNLLLDAAPEMLAGGDTGPALVPGEPEASLIVQAVRYDGLEMPPKKRLPEAVVNDFIEWVKMGAPDPRTEPVRRGPRAPQEPLWSLQPVSDPSLPEVRNTSWPRDPIDHFLLAALEQAGEVPVEDADPAALRRRLHFDLLGLPPAPDDAGDPTDPAYIDRLLASPHLGEKWGRHWLDVARYAESNGNDGLSRNPSFPHAWRYRDYVVAAFNDDLPYDRFLLEQLAGDLLPADTPAQRDRLLIATGLLALGSKPAKAMNENFDMDVVADQIGVVGSGLLGLSIGCARCHDHKTDPIPTRDYYALAGIFRSTETLWGPAAYQSLTAPQTPLHVLQAAASTWPRPELEPILQKWKPRRAPAKPTFPQAAGTPLAMGVREAKKVEDCKIHVGGEARRLGPAVPRGFLRAMDLPSPAPGTAQSGRLELARWLTHPQNPLTARVFVNRVWLQLFGQGLVATPDDFGISGARPSHPELLDHLATRFMREGWSVKRLIRTLVLSRAYQLAARPGEHPRFAHQPRRRLEAEAIRDTMLAAAGELDLQPGVGSLIQERDVLINQLPSLHQPSRQRSLYLLMLRNSMPPELTPFNLPDATTVTGSRDRTTLATQALYLLNNPFVVGLSQRFAEHVKAAASDTEARLHFAYRSAFGRTPNADEMQQARDFLREAELMLASSETEAGVAGHSDAWAAFCQALLSASELRYVD
jgi:cytochrome c553